MTTDAERAPADAGTAVLTETRERGGAGVLALYTAASFASAYLLFQVQPMFSRMVLPLLGGTAAVWNTCMLFFQAALLAGYAYAHAGARWLGPRRQALAHLFLLTLAALALPIGLRGAAPAGGEAPVPWLLGVMLLTVGPPFVVLAANGPMLQRWFAHTGHRDAGNPYFLYAASNLGSMVALLGYPFVVEPRMGLPAQSVAWTAGYGVFVLLLGGCAAALWRTYRDLPASPETVSDVVTAGEGDAAPTAGRRVRWVLLAFVPSSLLLSVTTFLTTDITPAPLLWVVPLALYLLTFTLAFARRPPLRHAWMVRYQPAVVMAVVVLLLLGFSHAPTVLVPVHLVAFFVCAMVCHGELARLRPGVSRLTEFYLWISVGGALGGIVNVLAAPFLFPRMEEYPIVLVLACLLLPRPEGARRTGRIEIACAVGVAALLAVYAFPGMVPVSADVVEAGVAWSLAMLCLGLARAPRWFAGAIAAVLAVRVGMEYARPDVLAVERTFFGRYTVERSPAGHHALFHGSTVHGMQIFTPMERRRDPLSYYTRTGPLGPILAAAGVGAPGGGRRVGVVGLGNGGMAAYGAPGESWTFYEIDPAVEAAARDTALFTYLADARMPLRVVLGDGRLALAEATDGAYDVLVLDAFNSDAVPVHLLTREAMQLYLRKLAPRGMLVMHISNRYLDLEPVVAAHARDLGLAARMGTWSSGPGPTDATASWVVLARRPDDLGALLRDPRFVAVETKPGVAPWTDSFSNLWSVFHLEP